MRDHVLAVTSHQQPRTRRVTLHLGSALLGSGTAPSTSAVSQTRRAFSRTRPHDQRPITARSGLRAHTRTGCGRSSTCPATRWHLGSADGTGCPVPFRPRQTWSSAMAKSPDRHARTMLPIPDRPAPGLTTYDAKDPDTAFPPIEPLLPPEGAPNVLIVLLDDVGFGASSTFGGPCRTPNGGPAGRRRPEVQPVPHHGVVRADPAGAADRAQPPLGRDGQHHRDRDVGAGQQLAAAEHQGAAGDDAEAERLLDGAVRQVPRGAGVAVVADGAVRRVAVGRRRVRDVLRVHRRREQPVGSRAVRRHDPGRAAGDRRRRATT